jgi:hypothetical protein
MQRLILEFFTNKKCFWDSVLQIVHNKCELCWLKGSVNIWKLHTNIEGSADKWNYSFSRQLLCITINPYGPCIAAFCLFLYSNFIFKKDDTHIA